jgi:hypothetical protein
MKKLIKKLVKKPNAKPQTYFVCNEDPDCSRAFLTLEDYNSHVFTATHCEKCGYGNQFRVSMLNPCEGCCFEYEGPRTKQVYQ